MRKLLKKSRAMRETLQANCGNCSCGPCTWTNFNWLDGSITSSGWSSAFYGGK
ncbi:MAG: hypothetical protein N3B21_13760 [Clostridia bacterium]|nr:hypothetical protein [Clostridia bacterium]